MQRHELGGGEQLVGSLRALDAELTEAVAGDERVVRDHAHAEPQRAAGDLLADPPEAENTERLVGDLDAAVARALPAPVLQRRVGLRDVAGQRQQQADRVLRGGDDRRLGRIRDHDALARRRVDVDVVDADAGAADHLQPLGPLDQVGREFRRRADDDAVVVADHLGEVGVAVDIHLEAVA